MTAKPQPTVIVTGASGFLGKALCQSLLRNGFKVHALSRENPLPQPKENLTWYYCNLPHELDERAFSSHPIAVVHCAYNTKSLSKKVLYEQNILGSELIFNEARKRNIKIIFVSSMSAHEKAESMYGRSKKILEEKLNLNTDAVVRPGLILGPGGLFLRMQKLLPLSPIIPVFYANKKIPIVSIQNTIDGIVQILSNNLCGTFIIAHPQGITPIELYQLAAANLKLKTPLFLCLPATPLIWFTKLWESTLGLLNLQLPITSEHLLGLKCVANFDSSPSLLKLNLIADSPEKILTKDRA